MGHVRFRADNTCAASSLVTALIVAIKCTKSNIILPDHDHDEIVTRGWILLCGGLGHIAFSCYDC